MRFQWKCLTVHRARMGNADDARHRQLNVIEIVLAFVASYDLTGRRGVKSTLLVYVIKNTSSETDNEHC